MIITNSNIFMTLTDDRKIIVMQTFPMVVKAVNQHECSNSSRTIIDFDFVENRYLVLFHNDSVTEIYQTDNSIDIHHKMRLPKYTRYSNFTYFLIEKSQFPKRDIFEGTLLLLMVDKERNETAVLIYKLNEL